MLLYDSIALWACLLSLPVTKASPLAPREATVTATITVGPTPSSTSAIYDWADGRTYAFPIHHSCNSTLRTQLESALDETLQLVQHARDHILRWGNESPFVQKYFGNASTAGPIGWYERVLAADRTGMTFRCDDPDQNCATQPGWAGHWRGENATQETVICPLSFEIRRSLVSVCGLGYTVAESKLNTFWATDLLHRIFHVPKISEEAVDHYAEDYQDVIELAKSNPELSTKDSDTLQYFAIDVYAYDIAAPGIGCSGEIPDDSAAPSSTSAAAPSVTSSAPTECHTHSDGVVHCE